jgi:hypothetical protein
VTSTRRFRLSLQEPVVGALNVYAFERHDFTDHHNVGVLVDF